MIGTPVTWEQVKDSKAIKRLIRENNLKIIRDLNIAYAKEVEKQANDIWDQFECCKGKDVYEKQTHHPLVIEEKKSKFIPEMTIGHTVRIEQEVRVVMKVQRR